MPSVIGYGVCGDDKCNGHVLQRFNGYPVGVDGLVYRGEIREASFFLRPDDALCTLLSLGRCDRSGGAGRDMRMDSFAECDLLYAAMDALVRFKRGSEMIRFLDCWASLSRCTVRLAYALSPRALEHWLHPLVDEAAAGSDTDFEDGFGEIREFTASPPKVVKSEPKFKRIRPTPIAVPARASTFPSECVP